MELKRRWMKASLLLAAITFAFYFVFSSALIYIPHPVLVAFGFSLGNLPALLSYSFVHISLAHLFGNVVVLMVVGLIAEQKLRARDTVALYFLSGSVAAVLFSILEPGTVLVGSSAAISGLVITALLVDIKKAVVAIVGTLVLLSVVIQPLIASYVTSAQVGLAKQSIELNDTLEKTAAEKNTTLVAIVQTNESMQRAGEQFRAGLITNETYAATMSNLTAQYGNLSEKKAALEKNESETVLRLNKTLALSENVEEGRQRESLARTSMFVHLAGAMVGLIYIWFVRKDILWSLPSQLSMPESLSKRLRR